MGIIKNIRSIFPLPKGWENDSDRKAFGIRIEQTLRDLFARISRCVTFTKPTAETTLTSDQQAQARSNIGAADDSKVVHKTGAETITGNKTFTVAGGIYIQPNNRYKYVQFKQYGSEKTVAGMRIDSGNATNITKSQIEFYEYSPKATPDTGTTGNYELYSLPEATSGRTANVGYDILTTKFAVTIAQGGTGASSLSAAQTNLGISGKARRITGIVNHGETVTLSMENDYGVLFIGNSSANCVAWVYETTAIKVVDNSSSTITLTKTSKTLKIKNTAGSTNYRYYLIC